MGGNPLQVVLGELEGPSVRYTTDYYWVVVCKNHRFQHKGNVGYGHKILARETDAYPGLPMLPEAIKVRCDNCGKEYSYERTEIMRDEVQLPEKFTPHLLFK